MKVKTKKQFLNAIKKDNIHKIEIDGFIKITSEELEIENKKIKLLEDTNNPSELIIESSTIKGKNITIKNVIFQDKTEEHFTEFNKIKDSQDIKIKNSNLNRTLIENSKNINLNNNAIYSTLIKDSQDIKIKNSNISRKAHRIKSFIDIKNSEDIEIKNNLIKGQNKDTAINIENSNVLIKNTTIKNLHILSKLKNSTLKGNNIKVKQIEKIIQKDHNSKVEINESPQLSIYKL